MAVLRSRVFSQQLGGDLLLCIDAISYGAQGSDPKKRASVDVTAETTRFEVLVINTKTHYSSKFAGSEEEWLKRSEAKNFVDGFLAGIGFQKGISNMEKGRG